MSVTFYPAGADGRPLERCSCEDFTCKACATSLNVHNARGAALRAHLDLPAANHGLLPAGRVSELCEARLATLSPEPAGDWFATPTAGRVVVGRRPAGDMRDATAKLLEVARAAGTNWVAWS